MEDTLNKLDELTQEEARMAVAENLRATHAVDERMREVASTVFDVFHGAQTIVNQSPKP